MNVLLFQMKAIADRCCCRKLHYTFYCCIVLSQTTISSKQWAVPHFCRCWHSGSGRCRASPVWSGTRPTCWSPWTAPTPRSADCQLIAQDLFSPPHSHSPDCTGGTTTYWPLTRTSCNNVNSTVEPLTGPSHGWKTKKVW